MSQPVMPWLSSASSREKHGDWRMLMYGGGVYTVGITARANKEPASKHQRCRLASFTVVHRYSLVQRLLSFQSVVCSFIKIPRAFSSATIDSLKNHDQRDCLMTLSEYEKLLLDNRATLIAVSRSNSGDTYAIRVHNE